jgi:hypothetical protein
MPPPLRLRRVALRALVLVALLFTGLLLGMAHPARTEPARALASGDFEHGLDGWRGYRASVRVVRHGKDGRAAEVRLRRSRRGAPSFSIFLRAPATRPAGSTYDASAAVRARRGAVVCLRILELRGRVIAGRSGRCIRASGGWQGFGYVSYRQRDAGSRLSVAIIQFGTSRSARFRVDQIALTVGKCRKGRSCSTTTTTPGTTAATGTGSGSGTSTAATTTAPSGTTTTNPGATAPATRPAVGAQFHCAWSFYTNPDRVAVLDKLKAAGITWVRIDMAWSSIEDTAKGARNTWYIGMMDFCIDQARARGIKVLVTLWMTPSWANAAAGPLAAPTNPQDYADFARWAASYWRGRVSAWEVWNEPDPHQQFFVGSTAQYAAVLKAAYPAFKAGDPNALVVLGGPSSNDDVWIRQLYVLGVKGSFDVLATHPYQGVADAPPEQADDGNRWWFTHLPAVRQVMLDYGDGDKPIWFTEFGWSAHANWSGVQNWQRGVTPQQQGDYFVRAIEYTQANYPYATAMFWYKERANPGGTNVHEEGYALLNADLSERPVLAILRAYLTGG